MFRYAARAAAVCVPDQIILFRSLLVASSKYSDLVESVDVPSSTVFEAEEGSEFRTPINRGELNGLISRVNLFFVTEFLVWLRVCVCNACVCGFLLALSLRAASRD